MALGEKCDGKESDKLFLVLPLKTSGKSRGWRRSFASSFLWPVSKPVFCFHKILSFSLSFDLEDQMLLLLLIKHSRDLSLQAPRSMSSL